MSAPSESQTQPTDKEINFRNQQDKYEKLLAVEKAARLDAEQKLQQLHGNDDDDDSEPYVDKKRLEKKLAKSESKVIQQTQGEIQKAVQTALHEERRQNWMKQNSDFFDVMKHSEKLAQKDPELAESILEMPDTFERQKLVYKNIKALGLHMPEVKAPSIQEKIDQNRKSPFYQPTGIGTAPYASSGDYSAGGQKQAYDKMQELKARLRL